MRTFPWLSISLLLLANMAFGLFLRDLDVSVEMSKYVWIAAAVYITIECSVLSICWGGFQQFILRSFKSDLGYTLAALLFASFAVVIVVWIHIFGHFFVMLAAALLLRVDLFTRRIGTLLSFISLLAVSGIGLTLSWLLPNFYSI